MDEPGVPGLALRIERGRADEEELAALAVVLCSLLAGREAADTGQEPPGVPSWRRPEHSGAVYRSPYCWR
ncbi:acyl-CoA carboxylase subunit epsilon [Streptomyces spiralis]|uniref:acyl-CoA carboxylase subunit epsilon n=1 Tax=Streptomyces spiralis TaxID=66376 RepID=UPI0033ECFE5E